MTTTETQTPKYRAHTGVVRGGVGGTGEIDKGMKSALT